ncbi:MarR family winged helix-turn-helix transcriptional regulator [Roseomonas populi]|uniref:MarR family transcriptional regulator n=1 Tax=Roseomonas populi TaxID=3121582 RepID=A0ABT1XFJ3_9PROT|nr:MarR family transcriptional regulator [Roseomonas pecuniae]MCR0985744.1 MarR family transcriptional regulator [Roseomonas pecuniae]
MERESDAVDALVEAWRTARPELDPRHLHVLGRVSRIEAAFRRRVDALLAPLGLSWDMFDLMATLWRAPGHAMRPGELSRWCLLSSGAMTKRIDRLVAAGLARREADPSDRRAQLVRLTEAGVALAERAVPLHFRGARETLGSLSEREEKAFTASARKLLRFLEGPEDE